MFDDLVDSSGLEDLEMLYPNGQKQCNPMPNLKDKPVDIEIDLEELPNVS